MSLRNSSLSVSVDKSQHTRKMASLFNLKFLLAVFSLSATATASANYGAQRVPLGGSLFSLESHRLLERQNNDLGTDCGGDSACSTTDFGCGCGFDDGSWIDDPSLGGISSSSGSTSSAPPPLTTSTATSPQSTPPPLPSSSSSPSPLPSPTVAPADPPAAPSCVPNPTDAVKDFHEDELKRATKFFCSNYASKTVTTSNVNIAQTIISGTVFEGRGSIDIARLYTGSDNEDGVYNISVKSIDGCTPNGGYNLDKPVSGNSCPDILHSAWKQCMKLSISSSPVPLSCLISLIRISDPPTRFRQQSRSRRVNRRRMLGLQRRNQVLISEVRRT